MKSLYTLNRPLTARFVATITVVSLLLSAFPAAFFVAQAATNVFTDGFEPSTNLGNWTVTSGWVSAGDQNHTGIKSAKLAGPNNNNNNNNGGTQIMSKTISTVGFDGIVVSFWYRASDLEWSQNQGGLDKVEVSYTVNGSTWTEFNQIDGNSNDDNDENGQWNFVTLNLPSSADNNTNFALRFDGEVSSGNDNVWIDDVTVSGDAIVIIIDTDNDGVPDEDDNCPVIANQDQADTDDDGVGNACEPDTDGDTIADDVDNCFATPNTDQANFDDDALGDACDESTDYCLILDGVQAQNDVCQLPPEDEDDDDDNDEDEDEDEDEDNDEGEDNDDNEDSDDNDDENINDDDDDNDYYDQCPLVDGFQINNFLCLTPIDWCPDDEGLQHGLWQCNDDDDDDDDDDIEYCSDDKDKHVGRDRDDDDDDDNDHHDDNDDDDDNCIPPPPVDYCDTLPDVQAEDTDCPPPTTVCEEGEIIVDNQCVPEPQECVNLLTNGSFETEVVGNVNLWDRFLSVTGWTIGQVLVDAPTTLELHRNWSSNDAAQGAQYAELDGDHSTKISQSVGLTLGATYELKWAFAPRHDIDAAQNQLSVMVDDDVVDTDGPATGLANLTPGDWTQGTYSFVADGTSATIAFADAGPSDSYGTFLDDARLCKIADPEPVATIVAEKIVCETEADLPNWNDEGSAPNITADTAADWVVQSDGACWLEEGWQFEWGSQNASDPGDTLVGAAGGAWTTFGPTNGAGKATVFLDEEALDEDSYLWVREVLQEGYIPFTHEEDSDNSDNVTAEMYCNIDGLNYDNLDRVDGIELNETFHCVAFNAEIPKVIEQCTLEMYSDEGTVVVERNGYAVATYDNHSAWTAEIPGATWIWDVLHANEIDDEESETFTFEETFTVGNPDFADLDIAADNDYELIVNGTTVVSFVDNGDDNNYGSLTKDDIDLLPYLVDGDNVMRVKVKNFGMTNSNYIQNPAGLLYKLVVKGDDESCAVTTEPEVLNDPDTFRLDGYKYTPGGEENYSALAGWTIEATDGETVLSATTDSNGYYYFDVEVGDWEVSEVMQEDWEQIGVQENGEPLWFAEDELGYCTFDLTEDQEMLNYKYVEAEEEHQCDFFNDQIEDEPEPPVITPDADEEDNGGGGGGTRVKKKGTGTVLGASTSQCSMYLSDYMRSGLMNEEFEVKKLQLFLNIVQGNNIPVTGVFDAATDEAVRAFQLKYQGEVLTPWFAAGFVPHNNPTGWVYQLTRWKINNIVCPGSEAMPTLLP